MHRAPGRCYVVFGFAFDGASANKANEALNSYIGDPRRGVCVYHDHFVGTPGGLAVFDIQTREQCELLDDPGELSGWKLEIQPLAFSLTATGFAAQIDFTLENYAQTSLEELAESEQSKRRHWWARRSWRRID